MRSTRVRPRLPCALCQVEVLLAREPPVPNPPGVAKLREAVEHARSWLGRAQELLEEGRMCDVKSLEAAVAEAARLPGVRAGSPGCPAPVRVGAVQAGVDA